MGKIVRRAARWFADWLDRKAQRLEDFAYTIGAWAHEPVERSPGLLDDIVAVTLTNRSGALADNMMRNNALLNRLSQKNG